MIVDLRFFVEEEEEEEEWDLGDMGMGVGFLLAS